MNTTRPKETNPLADLIAEIELLLLLSEVSQLLLQENWPPSQKLSAYAALRQGRRESEAEFRSRMPTSDTKLLSMSLAPEHIDATLGELTEAIRQTHSLISDRVEKARGSRESL